MQTLTLWDMRWINCDHPVSHPVSPPSGLPFQYHLLSITLLSQEFYVPETSTVTMESLHAVSPLNLACNFKTISQVQPTGSKNSCVLGDLNSDCAESFPPVLPISCLPFWDHVLSITLTGSRNCSRLSINYWHEELCPSPSITLSLTVDLLYGTPQWWLCSALCHPSVTTEQLAFQDHLLIVTPAMWRALPWKTSLCSLCAPGSPLNSLPLQDHPPCITLSIQRALCLMRSKQWLCQVSLPMSLTWYLPFEDHLLRIDFTGWKNSCVLEGLNSD